MKFKEDMIIFHEAIGKARIVGFADESIVLDHRGDAYHNHLGRKFKRFGKTTSEKFHGEYYFAASYCIKSIISHPDIQIF